MCVSAVSGQSNAANLDAAIQKTAGDINQKLIMWPRVALLNFSSQSNDLSSYVLRELMVSLEKSRKSVLIARQETDRALGAMNLMMSGEVTDTAARQLGRSLNAGFVVTGSLVRTADNFRLRTKLINVSSGSVAVTSDIGVTDSQHIIRLLGSSQAVEAPSPVSAPAASPAPAPAPAPPPAQSNPNALQLGTSLPSVQPASNMDGRADPDAANWDIALLDTAKDAGYLSPIEKDVVLEMNKVRTNPKKYAELYIQPMLKYYNGKNYSVPGQITIATNEGAAAVNDCVAALNRANSAGILKPERGLSLAAKDHVTDQSRTGQTGHNGSDRSTSEMRMKRYGVFSGSWALGENIAYGETTGREIVCGLLIDDGVPGRGHRANIMNRAFTQTGAAFGTHTQYRTSCTITYAAGYISN